MGIKIKNPCEQDWNKMTPTKHGAYCCSCELEVIDFTGKSKLEIKSILKSKLGNQVCGKIKSEQLDELNYDFLQWKNTNQKVERTWILSLIIVFGLSLFSCEEETEKKAIISIQQIGWNVNQHVAPIINQFNRIEKEKSLSLEQHKTVHSQSPDKESIERFVLGEIDYEEDHISPLLKTDTIKEEINRIMLGGIGFSPEFNKHIEEHTVPKESDLLVLMAYPNPAYEQTTLKITFPSEMNGMIELFNESGQLIRNIANKQFKKGIHKLPIDLSDLPKGQYLITISSQKFKESLKLIKN